MSDTTAASLSRTGVLVAVSAAVCWAVGNVLVRIPDLTGLQLAFWRVSLGAGVYIVVLALRGRRLRWSHIRVSLPTGVAVTGFIAVFYLAIKSTTVTNASMILALLPVILLGTAIRRFGEPISLRFVGTVTMALAGTVLVLFGSAAAPTWSLRGDGLAMVATLLFAANFVLAKEARRQVPTLEFQAALWFIGSVLLLPVAVIDAGRFEPPPIETWGWVVALLAVPGTGHFLMNWAHRYVKLSISSTITLAVPVLSAIGAALFLDEPIVALQVIGAAIVMLALVTVIRNDLALG